MREKKHVLSGNGIALVLTMLSRLVFGGYLVFQDYFAYEDVGSALTVFGIYLLLGICTVLFMLGKRLGLAGILWLSIILIAFHTAFVIVSMVDGEAGLHDPMTNLWATVLRYPLFFVTLIFSIRVYRERHWSAESR
jgi:hypothetical protein